MTTISTAQGQPSRRRVHVAAIDRVDVVTEPVPAPAADEALVRMLVSGVCGSDTHGVHGSHPALQPPYYPGHEVVGEVEAVGESADNAWVGKRVTVEPPLPCGHCKSCRTAKSNICENLQFFGCGYLEGGMADEFVVRADRLREVPADFSLQQAALIEPLATPVHAVRLAGNLAGGTVVIIGCGTIGQLNLAAARAAGARTIVMTDVLADKRAEALERGADFVVDGAAADAVEQVLAALGERADVVFDCVAMQATFNQAMGIVAKGGTVVIVGVPSGDLQIPAFTVQDSQIRIQGAATYLLEDYEQAMQILAAPTFAAAEMITGSYPLAQAPAAFEAAASGKHTKVLLHADDVTL